MKHIYIAIVLFFLATTPALAQSTQYNTPTTGAVDATGSVDWRWVLPLLAVPILYVAWKSRGEDDEYRHYNDQYMGAKGGKAEHGEIDTMGTDENDDRI